MRTTTILSFLVAIMLSSCTTVYYTQSYEDANYLSPNEFAEFDDYTVQNTELEQEDEIYSDTIEDGTIVNNYYEADDYYDFSYSARIRRFHRPLWSMGYYGGLYTDYYWYSYNPYHCGMSIYYGYNYYDPFYSPYYSFGHSPYYSYYNHHYYGNNHHYNYGYNHHNDVIYSYNNSYDNNSFHYGPRGSMSSKTNTNRSVTSVVNSPNNKNTNSTYNKFDREIDKKITTRTIKTNSNRSVKTNTNRTVTKSNTTKSTYNRSVKTQTHKSNTNRTNTKNNTYNKGKSNTNRTYTAPKSNSNRSYNNSRGSSTRSSGNSRSSGSSGSNNRSVKPRK